MNKLKILVLIGACFLQCKGREPFKPAHGSLPFIAYFTSRYRGLCVGNLVSRTAVLTAAVCVSNPKENVKDTRSINVVVGSTYRHPRRGIRVQVTKILMPNHQAMLPSVHYLNMVLANHSDPNAGSTRYRLLFVQLYRLRSLISKFDEGHRGHLMSKSVAILLLKRKIPDALTEVPLRPIDIDWKGEEVLNLQEECLMAGWHFFYKGDKIYPVHKFLLQRTVRVQFLNIVKNLWCEALNIKFQKALSNLGFQGVFDKNASICVRDGMYGSALICRGRAVGMMMAPDGQWSNCTGFSNLIQIFSNEYLKDFMACVSSLFETEEEPNWESMQENLYKDIKPEEYDYLPEFYDRITSSSASSSDL